MENMKKELEDRVNTQLFSLLRQVLLQQTSIAAVHLTPDEFDRLLKLAKRHEVQPIAAYALLLSGGLTSEQEQRCRRMVYSVMAYQERMERELQKTCNILEGAGIPYMPLKGAVIRSLYPEPWLRTSGDIDILVKDADKAAQLLEENGYINKGKSSHDVMLISTGGITIELHFLLIEKDPRIGAILEQVWDYATPREGTCCYAMEPEMLYFYHIAHMVKHFVVRGCGIRFFADIWLMTKKIPMDQEKKNELLRKGGMATFAEQAERLSQVWFEDYLKDPLLSELESFVLNSGVLGSKSNLIRVKRARKSGNSGEYLLLRIFMPYDQMCQSYPVLNKYPVLLPVFWIRRWIERLSGRKKIVGAVRELTLNGKLDNHTVSSTKWLFEELDLF